MADLNSVFIDQNTSTLLDEEIKKGQKVESKVVKPNLEVEAPQVKVQKTPYTPPQNAWNQKEFGGELYMDRVFSTYQNWNAAREEGTFWEGTKAAFSNKLLST